MLHDDAWGMHVAIWACACRGLRHTEFKNRQGEAPSLLLRSFWIPQSFKSKKWQLIQMYSIWPLMTLYPRVARIDVDRQIPVAADFEAEATLTDAGEVFDLEATPFRYVENVFPYTRIQRTPVRHSQLCSHREENHTPYRIQFDGDEMERG